MTSDERLWGTLCHLAAFAACLGIPAGNILGPLLVWLLKKDEFPLVADQGKESLNFQISMTIYGLVCLPLVFLLIGFPLLIIVMIAALVFPIMAAVKANSGVPYRYPMTIRLVK